MLRKGTGCSSLHCFLSPHFTGKKLLVLMGFQMHRSHWNRGQGDVQAASFQRASYYRHLPFVQNLHRKRGKNAQLANQNVTPKWKIPALP